MDNSGLYANVVLAAAILVIVIYVWRMNSLIDYIRRVHTATWEKLGRPSLQPARSGNMTQYFSAALSFVDFALVSRQHRILGDAILTRQLWSLRALFIVGALFVIVGAILDPHGPWAAFHH
jgi:hypothetical protein